MYRPGVAGPAPPEPSPTSPAFYKFSPWPSSEALRPPPRALVVRPALSPGPFRVAWPLAAPRLPKDLPPTRILRRAAPALPVPRPLLQARHRLALLLGALILVLPTLYLAISKVVAPSSA